MLLGDVPNCPFVASNLFVPWNLVCYHWPLSCRVFSTFHAVFVAAGSLYLLLVSNLFVDTRDELFINRSSTLSDTILGVC